ncbi:DctP family TRAP transporter solute-binding subunit [Salinibacterium sp. UTAS2018]|uniref:DctP family TRAP transporter solute-binding subunit n=1 Tax=unclassified Salinibacterium TaxID=2632331 RepID=UPI0010096D11|nr:MULTISPECIES: DctP family TRAP transporter solute-binding subunit [unclassified Salinibacterium]MBH0009764.1 DctP family TRAP transporter solute-binding subunit [Salinibacterium sp. SWN1162]QAV71097.1 DctP family TRAP transporter solute-binding subunit [Salinibacterium sp. UTAS2018]
MKFVKIAASTLGLALVLTGCSTGSSDSGSDSGLPSYDWDFTITVSDKSSWNAGAERFAEVLDEESDGRIKVNIFTNEQLSGGDSAAGVEQLMNGDKAFSYNSTIIYSGIDPRFGTINAPFLYDSYETADAAIEAGALDAYKELSAEFNVQLLGFGESGFRQITNSKHEILAPDDLDGLKFRVPGSSLFLSIFKELGADPVSMNFSEVFTSLQTGTIDGQENPYDVIYSNGLTEVQDYMSVWNYIYDPLMLGMNKDMYDALSDDDKALVEMAAAEANEVQKSENRAREAEQLAEMSEIMTVSELSASQLAVFTDAMAPVYDEFTDAWTPELLAAVRPE